MVVVGCGNIIIISDSGGDSISSNNSISSDSSYGSRMLTYKHPSGTTTLVASKRDDGQTLKLNRAPNSDSSISRVIIVVVVVIAIVMTGVMI